MLQNKFIQTSEHENAPIAPFPYQNLLTRDIRTAAAKISRIDLIPSYAGQNYPLLTNLPASEIVPLLIEQTVRAIQNLNKDLLEKASSPNHSCSSPALPTTNKLAPPNRSIKRPL